MADGAPLLSSAPAGDEVADPVVEPEAALLPELEHRDRGHGLARGVPEHDVVDRQRLPCLGFSHGDVEQRLATHRHVALGPELPAVAPLAFQEANHLGEVKSGGHDAEA